MGIDLTSAVQLAYEEFGAPEAPPTVLLHGLGGRANDWAPVVPRLAQRLRVLALDLRGHGESEWPGEYSYELMAADVVAFLDRLDLQHVTLVGHSMGGVVAYRIAAERPDLVERLVVEDVAPPSVRDRPIPLRDEVGDIDFDWPVVPAIVGQTNAGDPAMWDGLARITAPTLLIGGGPESHIPSERLAEAAAGIPGCTLITIAAGHHVHSTRPDEFADAVLDWLSARQIEEHHVQPDVAVPRRAEGGGHRPDDLETE